VGKTRLAFEVARRAAGSSVGGVRAVLLADLPPGSDVTERVALALGASGRAPTLSESIADWARNNEALVVLDNCEQVVESVARVVDHLLVESSRVTVLVTSRQPLRVADEVTWRLPAMPTDDADEESDAVALLRERAAAARPELSLDPALARELCRDLDGLPLAIEIAAARLLHMSPEQLRRSLGDRMAVLRSSRRDVPERQRTLDALLRWSYDLLDPGERDVLARVAIFSSPFDLDAATAVAASTGTEVVDALGGLVDHSLLQLVGGPETRYRMLMTVRDFARERLREQERLAATADRHAQWIITRLKPLADRVALQREDYLDARRTFDELYDDAIAALEHLDATADDRSFAELTCALFDYWYARGLVATARRWFARALRSEDPRVLSRAGSLDQAVGADGDAVLGRLLSACDRARKVGDGRVLAECLARAGAKAVEITDGASGEEQLREALEIPEARDIDRAAARNGLAMLANRRGDIEGSLREYDLALEACEHLPIGRALLQQNLAEILVEEHGDLDRAEALVLDALSVLEERDPTLADFGHEVLHRVALARGDRETARYWLDRALESLERLEQPDPRDVERMRELRGKL
jgi:predicted ATPase